ncbi:lipocalin-like domain-containing protein [Streptomyces sp. NPDC004542]|uniref:lipocalin-like domain-containing protein n=1 Tax=Streptomyces sp. NPDC004542 TaxID=3154281 RepID=UPI0033AEDE6F
MSIADELEGSWALVAWEQRYEDGRVVTPMGSDPAGVITYTGGRMQCVMARRSRSPFVTGGQWDASQAERATAYDECMAYAGSYTVDGDEVSHHVDIALFPNWVGGVQRRRARLDGDRLELVADLDQGTPQARSAHLVWRRLAPGSPL